MSKTCTACRGKKIRCDGARPICHPCTKSRRPVECSYTSKTGPWIPKRELLQRGAACSACRRNKKKCDAKRPCSACIAADKQHDCQYKNDSSSGAQLTSEPRHEPPQDGPLETSADNGEIVDVTHAMPDELGVSSGLQSSVSPEPSSSSTASSSVTPALDFSVMLDLESGMTGMASNFSHLESAAIEDNSSSYAFVSPDTAVNDLIVPYFSPFPAETLLLYRNVFLSHRIQLGLCITKLKLDALRCGDMTGDVIHPVLVHVAQLWGCLLSHWSDADESAELQAALNILNADSASLINDPTTVIQAQTLLAMYFIAKGDVHSGRECLVKGRETVMRYNLHIVEPTMVTSSYYHSNGSLVLRKESEAIDEQLLALCQLIYIDKCTEVVLHLPLLFTNDMDEELLMLSDVNAVVCSSSFIVQRARGLAFLQQAKSFSMHWNPDLGDASSSSWYTKYWYLMRSIQLHQVDVKSAMLRASFPLDRQLSVVFKICYIMTLTALAYLHDFLAPKHSESRRSCFDMVIETVHITDSIADEDYPLLDPVIPTCWAFAADILKRERQLSDLKSPMENSVIPMLVVLQQSAQKLKKVMPYTIL